MRKYYVTYYTGNCNKILIFFRNELVVLRKKLWYTNAVDFAVCGLEQILQQWKGMEKAT